jgi:O-antigen ligase
MNQAPTPNPPPLASRPATLPPSAAPLPRADSGLLTARVQSWLQSDNAVLAGMLLALGIYYFTSGLIPAIIGGALFFALAIYRPKLTIACIALAIPLFYRSRSFELPGRTLYFPPAEFIILAAMAAWAIHDGVRLLRGARTGDRGGIVEAASLGQRLWRAAWAALTWPFAWGALAFLIVGALSLVLPPLIHRDTALREFRWMIVEPVLFFALIARFVRNEDDVLRAINAFLIAAAVGGSIGAQQFLYGETWSMEGVGRATGVWPGATAFGIFMGRALPLAVVLALFLPRDQERWRRRRWAYALLAVPIAAGMITSFARGAWLGVAVALVVVVLVTRNRLLLIGLGVLAVALVPVLYLFRGVERLFSLFGSETGTGTSRIIIWQGALRVIRDHRLTGIGLDQFLYQDPKYGIPNLRFLTVSHPHNFLLDFWLRLGIWGLGTILAILSAFFLSGLRAYRRFAGTVLGAVTLALIAAMTDFVAHGLLDMAYFYQDLALTFWLLVGLMSVVWFHTQARIAAEEANVIGAALAPSEPASAA